MYILEASWAIIITMMWFFIKFCNVIQILLLSIQLYIYNTIFHEGSRQMTELLFSLYLQNVQSL